jgi:hypothetical protein
MTSTIGGVTFTFHSTLPPVAAPLALPTLPICGPEEGDGDGPLWDVDTCRICGCDDEHACEGGCMWVPDPAGGDLCSTCWLAAFEALQRQMTGQASEADVDLLHRFAETGPYQDNDPLRPSCAAVSDKAA